MNPNKVKLINGITNNLYNFSLKRNNSLEKNNKNDI